jgi:hypothetical protein
LPLAVVNVVERVEGASIDFAGVGNHSAGCKAPSERAGEDHAWTPAGRNTLGDGLCLGLSSSGQRKVGATAKSFRLDAFDMPMTGQENFHHAQPRLNGCHRAAGRYDPRGRQAAKLLSPLHRQAQR